MTIWRAGMKAVCVDDRPLWWGQETGLRYGRVYTVKSVGFGDGLTPDGVKTRCAVIELFEVANPYDEGRGGPFGFAASRFRPAVERSAENKHFASLRDLLTNSHKVLEEA